MYEGLHVKCPLYWTDFNETIMFSTLFRKIFKYGESSKSGNAFFHFGRTEGRTDMTSLTVIFAILRAHKKPHVLPTQCIYVFCVDLRTNSDYFPIQH